MSYQFASSITDAVTLADGVNTVTVKKLGYKAQEAALSEKQRLGLLQTASYGSNLAAVQDAIRKAVEAQGGTEAIKAAIAKDPFLQYDKTTLLEKGIVSWTLSEEPTPKQIEDLSSADADKVARAIFALFHESEDDKKNA